MSCVLRCFSTEKSIFAPYFTIVAKTIGAAQSCVLKMVDNLNISHYFLFFARLLK